MRTKIRTAAPISPVRIRLNMGIASLFRLKKVGYCPICRKVRGTNTRQRNTSVATLFSKEGPPKGRVFCADTLFVSVCERSSPLHSPKPPITILKIRNRLVEFFHAEIGEERVDVPKFRIRRLPKQEVRQPLLAAGSDD